MSPHVEQLRGEHTDEVVDVLGDAFGEYPVMRFVIGTHEDYAERLTSLVGFFVAARVLKNEPMLGIRGAGRLVAVAVLTPPGQREAPPQLDQRREALWNQLGNGARQRYERLGHVWKQFAIDEPHHHLNMIGVRHDSAGQGLGRRLLAAVHALSDDDRTSSGVSLTTEDPDNVPLYEHVGYQVVGHARVTEELETWGMFREN